MIDLIMKDFPYPIETPRLILRPPMAGDGEDFFRAVIDGYEDLIFWLNWSEQRPSVLTCERECRTHHATFLLREDIRFLCLRKDTEEVIGRFAFPTTLCNWQVPSLGISYFIARRFQNQGFAAEATNALTRYAFEALGARRVEIKCDSENLKSIRVPTTLGFEYDGTQRGTWYRRDRQNELASFTTYSRFSAEGLPVLDVRWGSTDENRQQHCA